MIRLLLASTALAAVLATGALAQSSSSSMPDSSMSESSAMDSSVMSSQMSDASSMESSMMSSEPLDTASSAEVRTPIDILSGYTRADTDQLASKIIGSPVYDSTSKDANNLGKINDLVLNANGQIGAVVVGVGGFLGMGEKQVAVDYSALQWVVADDNTERFVLQTTKDQLTQAPDFKTVDDQPSTASTATDTAVSSSSAQ